MDEPLGCPFCGEPEQIFVHSMDTRYAIVHFATCIVCDCRGPYDHTPAAAIAAWNRRAPWTVTRERLDAILNERHGTLVGDEDMVEALGGKVEG